MSGGGWKYKMGRVLAHDVKTCGHVVGDHLCGEAAPYRVHAWQGQHDGIREKFLCLKHAPALAFRVGLKFPPMMWEA